ncbi:uncharacterized protein LOC141858443 [Brevipalpus obovatus]|uniref:uncharacterized protein LOC141858443 n=1 Tax=Brevipalpus obovatus TaxID=246614 RepID=UPI003D9F2E69
MSCVSSHKANHPLFAWTLSMFILIIMNFGLIYQVVCENSQEEIQNVKDEPMVWANGSPNDRRYTEQRSSNDRNTQIMLHGLNGQDISNPRFMDKIETVLQTPRSRRSFMVWNKYKSALGRLAAERDRQDGLSSGISSSVTSSRYQEHLNDLKRRATWRKNLKCHIHPISCFPH